MFVKVTLSVTSVFLLFGLCLGAPTDPCQKKLAEVTTNVQDLTDNSTDYCEAHKSATDNLNEALSSCVDTSTTVVQELLLASILDLELREALGNCDLGLETKLYSFLTAANMARVKAADNQIAAMESGVFKTCVVNVFTDLETGRIEAYKAGEDICTYGVFSWNSMTKNILKCVEASKGDPVPCEDRESLRKVAALNIDAMMKMARDYPEVCTKA